MTTLSRRFVLGASSAMAAVAALPAIALPVAPAVEAAPIVPPVNPRAWGWGFWRNGDEIIHGPYGSRAEAIEAGKEYFEPVEGDDSYSFDTGECDRQQVNHGDYHEALVNELCESGTDVAWTLQTCLEGSNEDNNWEGEVAEAIAAVDWKSIETAVLPVIWRAVERSGFFVLDIIEDEFDGNTGLIDALDRDAVFKAELQAVIHPMVEASGVMASSLMLQTYNDETHSFAAEETPA